MRTRDSPWGAARNTKVEQLHTDLHSDLWRNSMSILLAIGMSGAPVTNEHPKDPGRDPYPSTWDLSEMKSIERKLGMYRTIFPQCEWGMSAQKLTCISGTAKNIRDFDVHGTGTCKHEFHEQLIGLDEKGRFRTRKAQSYPPAMCKKLAQCFIDSWKDGG